MNTRKQNVTGKNKKVVYIPPDNFLWKFAITQNFKMADLLCIAKFKGT